MFLIILKQISFDTRFHIRFNLDKTSIIWSVLSLAFVFDSFYAQKIYRQKLIKKF